MAMAARGRTHQEIIDLLGRAAAEAKLAESYHAAAADSRALKGPAAQQVVGDAAAMQLIELAGCAEEFTPGRGDPGTTLARFDDALEPLIKLRTEHAHPEMFPVPQAVTPRLLKGIIDKLKTAIGNLDSETRKTEAPDQVRALNGIVVGLVRIEKDGLPDAAKLRERDLHYAGYYHEIQFGRLAKETGLYQNKDKAPDARLRDVNACIGDADDMAHRFHDLRGGFDKSVLPVSVVSPGHRERVPGRSLSELVRELRHERQTPAERQAETEKMAAAKEREEHREAAEGLAATYARITGDPKAGAAIRDYVGRCEPRLDTGTLRDMRQALETAASPAGDYLAVPDMVRNRCDAMCLDLDARGDHRLLDILDAAEKRGAAIRDRELVNVPQPETEEKDRYLASMLATHEPESSQVKEGVAVEVVDEPSQKHGQSCKNN
jgi:hypothetical protein